MWYVVKSGDSLYSISRNFNVSIPAIIEANKLTNTNLYVGQRLYIPVSKQITYVVKAGDSIYSIAQKFGTTIDSIEVLNNLSSPSLSIGQILMIPLYTEVIIKVEQANIHSGPSINSRVISLMVRTARLPVISTLPDWIKVRLHNMEVGWILRSAVDFKVYDGSKPIMGIVGFYTLEEGTALPSSFRSFVQNTSLISEVPLFFYRFNRDNPTIIEKFGSFSDNDINTLVAIAHRNNVMILPVVHNLLYRPGGQAAGKDVIRKMLATKQSRTTAINNIIKLVQIYNFDGVNIDIEDVHQEDSQRLSAFYTELGIAFKANKLFLSASVPSRVSDQNVNPFSDPFDYAVIGAAVDQFIVMLYNEHGWPGSGPGPVVSSTWLSRVISYAVTKMPKQKIVAAISVFGFDFNLTTGKNSYASFQAAMQLSDRYNKEIIFDQATQTPMFAYTDSSGDKHEVWFENKDSILAKIKLSWQLGISGTAFWRLGMEDPATWPAIAREIVVKKF